jgi:ABC-type transporter Mla subunit MlaD
VPVELDRIYSSIKDLAEALGPNGVNKDGTLNHLLEASAHALDGQGQRGNQMIRQLSEAAATFGQGAGRCSTPSTSWPGSPTSWPPTTSSCGPSSRT